LDDVDQIAKYTGLTSTVGVFTCTLYNDKMVTHTGFDSEPLKVRNSPTKYEIFHTLLYTKHRPSTAKNNRLLLSREIIDVGRKNSREHTNTWAGEIRNFILLMQKKRNVISRINNLIFITIRQTHATKKKQTKDLCQDILHNGI
jgi:hypothetical protein